MDLSKTCIFSLDEDSQIRAVLTSASICDASLNEVATTLIMGCDAIAAIHQNGSIFEGLPAEPFMALGLQIAIQRPAKIGQAQTVVDPGIYTVLGCLPLSKLPTSIMSPEFAEFWAFVCQSVGQTISWSGLKHQITISVIGAEGEPISSATLARRPVGRLS